MVCTLMCRNRFLQLKTAKRSVCRHYMNKFRIKTFFVWRLKTVFRNKIRYLQCLFYVFNISYNQIVTKESKRHLKKRGSVQENSFNKTFCIVPFNGGFQECISRFANNLELILFHTPLIVRQKQIALLHDIRLLVS